MPKENDVTITVSAQTKQLIDEQRGTLTYNDFLDPLVEKDMEYCN